MPQLHEPIHLQVIVAGMPRTGTDSIKTALKILYGPGSRVYHMSEVLNRPAHLRIWSDLAFGRTSPKDLSWQDFLGGYVATTDMPCAYYFEDLAQAFPDAKIILNLRDEADWYESYIRVLTAAYQVRFLRFLPPLNRFWPYGVKLNELVFGELTGDPEPDRKRILEAFRQHNQRVRDLIPAERLLEYRVEEGWGPLCAFLGQDVPAVPFPHRNAGVAGPRQILLDATRRLSLPLVGLGVGLLALAGIVWFFVR